MLLGTETSPKKMRVGSASAGLPTGRRRVLCWAHPTEEGKTERSQTVKKQPDGHFCIISYYHPNAYIPCFHGSFEKLPKTVCMQGQAEFPLSVRCRDPEVGVFPVGGLLGAAQREDSPLDDWRTYSFAENLGGTWKAFLLHQVMWEE